MPSAKTVLFVTLGTVAVAFVAMWYAQIRRARRGGRTDDPATDARPPTLPQLLIGAVTNFFDTLGIGSFATTTALFRIRGAVPDRLIPGTLNVGHTIPTFLQAFIYITIVKVDMWTLVPMIAAAALGAWLGSGIVAGWSKRNVQFVMGAALLIAAVLMLMKQLGVFPKGGEELGLRAARLALGLAGNFLLGALMTAGIGLYAPCMVLVSLLGMSPTTAFPIMMGSCAFLMPVGSVRFIGLGSYALRAALGLAIGGVPAVLIAAIVVRSLRLDHVRWLVTAVVIYTALAMLRSALVTTGTHRPDSNRAGT